MEKIIQAWELIIYQAYYSLRAEISRYYLHFVWWLMEPILNMAVMYVVFSVFLRNGRPHFIFFLLAGLVLWQWFASTVNNASSSILNSRGVSLVFRVHPIHFPLCVFVQNTIKFFMVFCFFLVVCVLFGPQAPSALWLAMAPVLLLEAMCIVGVSIFTASLVPFLPDLVPVVRIIVQLLFFATGIFYDINDLVLPQHRFIIYSNPNAICIKSMRDILINGQMPDWRLMLYGLAVSLTFLVAAIVLLNKFKRSYARVISQ